MPKVLLPPDYTKRYTKKAADRKVTCAAAYSDWRFREESHHCTQNNPSGRVFQKIPLCSMDRRHAMLGRKKKEARNRIFGADAPEVWNTCLTLS